MDKNLQHKEIVSLDRLITDLSTRLNLDQEKSKAIEEAFLQWREMMSEDNGIVRVKDLDKKLGRINVVVFDFDGVMTDNKVFTDQNGKESVSCDRADGLGIKQLKKLNKQLFILSTETNPVVIKRAEKLCIECFSGCDNKAEFLKSWMLKNGYTRDEVAFVGNDINDIGVMGEVGITFCPKDSDASVLSIADVIVPRNGGDKVVRAIANLFCSKGSSFSRGSVS